MQNPSVLLSYGSYVWMLHFILFMVSTWADVNTTDTFQIAAFNLFVRSF